MCTCNYSQRQSFTTLIQTYFSLTFENFYAFTHPDQDTSQIAVGVGCRLLAVGCIGCRLYAVGCMLYAEGCML